MLTPEAALRAGTQTAWNSLMKIPNSVLNAATGIPESTFTEFKKMPQVIAPGTGGEACLARCNITFQAVRLHYLSSLRAVPHSLCGAWLASNEVAAPPIPSQLESLDFLRRCARLAVRRHCFEMIAWTSRIHVLCAVERLHGGARHRSQHLSRRSSENQPTASGAANPPSRQLRQALYLRSIHRRCQPSDSEMNI